MKARKPSSNDPRNSDRASLKGGGDQPPIGAPAAWSPNGSAWSVLASALLLYVPSLWFGFVGWDDTRYIIDSPLITQPGGLWPIWTSREPEQYYPLTFTTFWIEFRLWKGHPLGYHAVNVALHGMNTVLVLLLMRRLGLTRWAATALSLLFAVHPVQVQTVVWLAERKNLLSGLFALLALLFWCRYRQEVKRRWYAASLAAFLAAMLSKTVVIALPLILMMLDRSLWRLAWRRSFTALVPMLLISIALAVSTIGFEQKFVSQGPAWSDRPLIAATAITFYALRMALPLALQPIYPRWEISPGSPLWWLPAVALTVAVWIAWRRMMPIDKRIGIGFILFLAFLLPVVGIVSYGNLALTWVSDHYLYLPSIGWAMVALLVLQTIRIRYPRWQKPMTIGGVCVCLVLALLSLRYMPAFADAQTMWTRTLEGDPTCTAAHAGLGRVHEDRQDWIQARKHYEIATQLAPHAEAFVDLARVLRRMDQWPQAEQVLSETNRRFPQSALPLLELARMALHGRDVDRAFTLLQDAQGRNGDQATIQVELGGLCLGRLRREEAEGHFRKAVALDPRNARAYLGLATSLRGQHRFVEAVGVLDEGLRIRPHDLALINFLARILATAPDAAVRNGIRAIHLAESARRLTRDRDREVLDTAAAAYAEAGRWDEAMAAAASAEALARSANDAGFVEAMQLRMESFRAHQPVREVSTVGRGLGTPRE